MQRCPGAGRQQAVRELASSATPALAKGDVSYSGGRNWCQGMRGLSLFQGFVSARGRRFPLLLLRTLLWIPLIGVILTVPASAQGGLQLPEPVGYVTEFANIIDPERERQIEAVIQEVRAKSGGEMVVVTLPSLQGRTADEGALQLGRQWGVGRAGEPGDPARNTGLIVLVAPQERRWKIEVGLGTNTFITAAEAGRVGRDEMVPAFQ